jgi:tyrosinase
VNRGRFVLSTASAAALAACSSSTAGFTPPPAEPSPLASFTRLEVSEFSRDAELLASFRKGVAAMMAIADPEDERSWEYWHRCHYMSKGEPPSKFANVWNQCKHHDTPYFYAWHRAFVYFFEAMVRRMAGNPKFALPYWDYYTQPELPAIFTELKTAGGAANPLYWPGRVGTQIKGLWYRPFAPTVERFPIGSLLAYEHLVEIDPHGFVHDEIGGDMGHVPTAALDPIFWVHHCNIDRLWSAWVAAGQGRQMPPAGDAYYRPRFTFNLAGTWSMDVATAADEAALGVKYADLSLPVPPPDARLPVRPQLVANGPLALTSLPVSVEVAARPGATMLQLDGFELTPLGERGGFAIRVYVDLPEHAAPLSSEDDYAAGHVGSFGISESHVTMRGMRPSGAGGTLMLPLPEAARGAEPAVVSFVPALAGALPASAVLARCGRVTLV